MNETKEALDLLKEEIEQELEEERKHSIESDDDLIYHRMWPTFYLSRWNEWQ